MAQRNRSISLKPGRSRAALTITHPNVAGIDIGSASHFVAVPPDRDDEPVREFASFTVDLNANAEWLQACSARHCSSFRSMRQSGAPAPGAANGPGPRAVRTASTVARVAATRSGCDIDSESIRRSWQGDGAPARSVSPVSALVRNCR